MKFSLGWLREHIEIDGDLLDVTERLTMIGLEVERVTDLKKTLEDFVVGHVVSARPHPNADRLRLCDVDIGADTFQVVWGDTGYVLW